MATMSSPVATGGDSTAGMQLAAAATQPGSEGCAAATAPSPVATSDGAGAAVEARPVEPCTAGPLLQHSAERGSAADSHPQAALTAAEAAASAGDERSAGGAAAGTGVGRDLSGCRSADAAAAGGDSPGQLSADGGDDRHPSGAEPPDVPPLQGARTPELRSLCRRHRPPSDTSRGGDSSGATVRGGLRGESGDNGSLGKSGSGVAAAAAAAAGAAQGGVSQTLAPAA